MKPPTCPHHVGPPKFKTHKQCSRRATRDGFCYQHHPLALEARDAADALRRKLAEFHDPLARLARANQAIENLRAALARPISHGHLVQSESASALNNPQNQPQ